MFIIVQQYSLLRNEQKSNVITRKKSIGCNPHIVDPVFWKMFYKSALSFRHIKEKWAKHYFFQAGSTSPHWSRLVMLRLNWGLHIASFNNMTSPHIVMTLPHSFNKMTSLHFVLFVL